VLVAAMAGVVVVLVGVLLVTRGGSESPESRLEGVADAVADAGTAHLALTVDVAGVAVNVTVSGKGQVEFASGAGSFDLDLLGRQLEMRTDGTTLYVLPAGETTWLAVRSSEAGGSLGSFGTGPSEAVAFVDLLAGDHGTVKDLGTEQVGTVKDAHHLRTTIDVADAAERADGDSKPALEQLATLAPASGKLPVDVWLDRDGRPVRERLKGTLQGAELVVTVELTKWGATFDVQVPPEGEVRDVEPDELLQLFSQPIG
jgi:hypothetical protein